MNRDIKSFFLLTSSVFLVLFIFSSLFAYNFFNLSQHLSFHERSQLFMGWTGLFGLIILMLYLIARKFLFPILEIKGIVTAQKEGKRPLDNFNYFNDELSFINEHILNLKKELEEDENTLNNLSLSDPRTGISSRRYFVEFGEKVFKIAKRNKEPLSLIMFDIDHLRALNVKYGKESGDKVISLLTEVVEESIRKSDIFARYADDIFVILLPQTDEEMMQTVIQKVQSTFHTAEFKHKANAYFTITMGSSSLREGDVLLRDLTKRADLSLNQAKQQREDSV